MSRVFLALCLAFAFLGTSCATVEGWFEEGVGFEVIQQQAQSIAGIQPRVAAGASSLADAVESALADPASASLKLGDELDVLLDRFNDGAGELDSKRNHLRELAERMNAHWNEYTMLLPESHPWREGGEDERERLNKMLNHIDSTLASTQSAMAGVSAKMRPAVASLREGSGMGKIEKHREALESALDGLREVPALFDENSAVLDEFLAEFSNV